MGDVPSAEARHGRAVLITIRVDDTRALEGDVTVEDRGVTPFAGWLDLLGILVGVLPGPAGTAPPWIARRSFGVAEGLRGELHPGSEAELGQDVGDVGVDRVAGQEEPLGDLPVGEALGDEGGDDPFGVGQ